MEAPENGLDDGIVGGVDRLDGEISKRIGRRPLVEQPAQRPFWIGGLQERPIGLLADPSKQNVKTRLQPDREAMPRDIIACGRIHECAPAGRQHHRPACEQAGDHLAFALAEISLAKPLEDLGNGQLSARFNLRVGVDEGQSKLCRKTFSDRGFSSPHHSDQNHRTSVKRRHHLPCVDRLALAHKTSNLAWDCVRAVPYKRPPANASRDNRFGMDPQPSCAPRLFLRPCQKHDGKSAVVDDADAKTQRRRNTEETASQGVGRPAKGEHDRLAA